MRRFKAAVFDLDGTILDTSEGVLSSVRYAIEASGLPMLPDETLRTFIGPPVQKSFARLYGLSKDEADRAADLFRTHYKDADLMKAKPYSGIYNLFSGLAKAGIKPAIATYKREDYAVRLLRQFHFDEYTDIMRGSDFEGKLTKSDIIRMAIRDAGCTEADAVMIGDSDNDAAGAGALGVSFVGVTYGFGFGTPADVRKFPNIGVADSPREILSVILHASDREG